MRLRLGAFARYRPRVLTVVVLLTVAATLVLSNLSFDEQPFEIRYWATFVHACHKSYGWPLIWHRFIIYDDVASTSSTVGWYYSPTRLLANVALWLVILIAPAAACEWLVRRYRPRLRWGLRTMLAAIALIAALCTWCVAARNRANVQEPLIAEITARGGRVMFARFGPQWLDLFGVDAYRRRIVGAELESDQDYPADGDAGDEAILRRLGQLPGLKYLFLTAGFDDPRLIAALAEMRQLRVLGLQRNFGSDAPEDQWMLDDCLSAVAQMTELEELYLSEMRFGRDHLARFDRLKKLRSLSLAYSKNGFDPDSDPPLLSRLPALLRLEALDVSYSDIGDADLHRLAVLPRLKSLDLMGTQVSAAGLAQLGALDSLEELATDVDLATAAGLDALLAIKRLKRLHIESNDSMTFRGTEVTAKLPLDRGDEAFVRKADLDGCLRALATLRREKPGIVIDADRFALHGRTQQERFWQRHDAVVGPRAAWLPASAHPWCTPAAKARCEAWLEEQGISISF
jgi:hypothetical protein